MKKILLLLLIIVFASTVIAQSSYSTSKGSGTIMISGAGTYSTVLDQELKSSEWDLGVDGALFLFPQLAAGLEFGYKKAYHQEETTSGGDPDEIENIGKYFGPRVYFFLGGKNSELTPFVKGGANYLLRNVLVNEEEIWSNQNELGLTASAGLLLNLAKNVGLSVEAEYNFEKGTAVEDIDTQQLLIKFGIRSFLSD
jgi:opacity protein-like surface antigen